MGVFQCILASRVSRQEISIFLLRDNLLPFLSSILFKREKQRKHRYSPNRRPSPIYGSPSKRSWTKGRRTNDKQRAIPGRRCHSNSSLPSLLSLSPPPPSTQENVLPG
ncbi:hypothetical protein CDAR_458021 [Caerostris darwini]|uniref:Uncharacterized protein n=1 Tax=Caerostris darwini TaxID=1538125 RepID=A0AAV4TNQ1_9ARAC|nr:hypothetical protein CDAR_458021 [Caerostris darwini]